jgi:2-methylisocitrate lyase-like PEP mutase family enzyme
MPQTRAGAILQNQGSIVCFQLILYPLAGVFAAAGALRDVYEKLKRDETTDGMYESPMTSKEFNDLVGVEEKYRLAERFGVK